MPALPLRTDFGAKSCRLAASMREMRLKRGGFCRLPRSMMAAAAARQRPWAASPFRSSVTGSRSSTLTVLMG